MKFGLLNGTRSSPAPLFLLRQTPYVAEPLEVLPKLPTKNSLGIFLTKNNMCLQKLNRSLNHIWYYILMIYSHSWYQDIIYRIIHFEMKKAPEMDTLGRLWPGRWIVKWKRSRPDHEELHRAGKTQMFWWNPRGFNHQKWGETTKHGWIQHEHGNLMGYWDIWAVTNLGWHLWLWNKI